MAIQFQNRRGTNSAILELPHLANLKRELEDSINRHFKEVYQPEDPQMHLYITQSWLNDTAGGEYHHQHRHSNSMLSGVLYLSVDPQDSIKFLKEREDLPLVFEANTFNDFNSTSMAISGFETGELLLFPSTLKHEVPVRHSKVTNPRISLAFNTFVHGSLGSEAGLTSLNI